MKEFKTDLGIFYNADCFDIFPTIESGSIDMVLCDLPYGTTACKWDVVLPFDKLWDQYKRIIKPNGAIILTASQPFTSALVMSNPKMFKYEWIWNKTKGSNFALANLMPMKSHENISVFYSKKPIYNPQFWYSVPYNIKASKRKGKIEGLEEKSSGSNIRTGTDHSDGKRFPLSILNFKRENNNKRIHPTQKPVALFEYLIKTYTIEGETVLDNCAGVCTTGIAAEHINRKWICIEKEEKYFDLGCERFKQPFQTKLL